MPYWSPRTLRSHSLADLQGAAAGNERVATHRADRPMRHLAKLRLGQAAGYLTTANLSVEAIAGRTGYASTASLSKAFKREFGVSPGTYRRRRGNIDLVRAAR